MSDPHTTEEVLVAEVADLRRRLAEMEEELDASRQAIAARKSVEEQLRHSEARYRRLFELAPDGIVVYVGEAVAMANDAAAYCMGTDQPETLAGKHFTEFIHPDFHDTVRRRITKIEESGESVPRLEQKYVRLDGRVIDVAVSGAPFTYQGQQAVLSVFRDITDRKEAREKLQASEQRLRSLFEAATEFIHVLDIRGNILQTNPAAVAALGYSEQEMIGRCMADFFAPDSQITFAEKFPLVLQKGYDRAEIQIVGKSGKVIDVDCSCSAIQGKGGSVESFVVFQRDITEQKRAEKRIRQHHEFLSTVLESLTHPFYVIDANTYEVLLANSAAGMSSSPWETFCYELTHARTEPCDSATHPCPVQELKRTGQPMTIEHMHQDRDGNFRSYEIHAYPVLDEKGNVAQIIEYSLDITDRKRLEEQLRQASKMQAIGQLAGGVAHDFNNILTVVTGYAQLLLNQLPEDVSYRPKVVQIERAAERAALFTRQLLAFSRKQVLDMRVLDLNVVIMDIEGLLGRLIGEHIQLETVLDPSLGCVEADPGQVQQILMNLSTNARDAMPAGGVLTMETRNVVLDAEYCVTRPELKPGPYVMLAVGDTGQGMDQATTSRIFEPFFTTKGLGMGTGLGLSTVYGIVKQHQGHISVYSEPGLGTAFKVFLPLVEGPALQEEAPRPMELSPHGRETLLVVEDDEIVHDLACEVLDTLGYVVISAHNPEEAITMCREHEGPIHLLLTDVVLPGMDGRSLFDRLSHSRADLKVLFMSGYAESFVFGNGVLAPGLNFLQKPFTVERLAGTIRRVLDEPEGESLSD